MEVSAKERAGYGRAACIPRAGSPGAGAGAESLAAGVRLAGANAAPPPLWVTSRAPGGAPEAGSRSAGSAPRKACGGFASRSRFSQRRTRARQSRMVWPPTFQPRASHQSRKRRGSMPLPRWPQYSSTSAKLGGVKPEKASWDERATPDCGAASGIISGTRAAPPCPASGEKATFWTAGTAGTAGRTSGEKAAFSTAGARPAGEASSLEISPFPACPAGVREAEISCTDASEREESPARSEAPA